MVRVTFQNSSTMPNWPISFVPIDSRYQKTFKKTFLFSLKNIPQKISGGCSEKPYFWRGIWLFGKYVNPTRDAHDRLRVPHSLPCDCTRQSDLKPYHAVSQLESRLKLEHKYAIGLWSIGGKNSTRTRAMVSTILFTGKQLDN